MFVSLNFKFSFKGFMSRDVVFFVYLLINEILTQICDKTIFCETFNNDLSLWSLENFTEPSSIMVDNDDRCPDNSCLKMIGDGGITADLKYIDATVNLYGNYISAKVIFDMYVGDIEFDGEGGNQIGTEYSGLQYSLDNGITYINGPIIYADDGLTDIGENQLYSDLNVSIGNISCVDSVTIRLVSFISAGKDAIFFDNIRLYAMTIPPFMRTNCSISTDNSLDDMNDPPKSLSTQTLGYIIIGILFGVIVCGLLIYLITKCYKMDFTVKLEHKISTHMVSPSEYDGVYSNVDLKTPDGFIQSKDDQKIDINPDKNSTEMVNIKIHNNKSLQAAVMYNNNAKVVEFKDYNSLLTSISRKFTIDNIISLKYQPEFSDFLIRIENNDDLNQCLKQKKVNIIVNDHINDKNTPNVIDADSSDDDNMLYAEGITPNTQPQINGNNGYKTPNA